MKFYILIIGLFVTDVFAGGDADSFSYTASEEEGLLCVEITNSGDGLLEVCGARGLPFYGLFFDGFFYLRGTPKSLMQTVRPEFIPNYVIPAGSEISLKIPFNSFISSTGETISIDKEYNEKKILVMTRYNGVGESHKVFIKQRK